MELPKFRESQPQAARRLRWAWLKFLREAGKAGSTGHPTVEEFSEQVGISDSLQKALTIAKECGFSLALLERYDKFWDAVSCERSLRAGIYQKGLEEGKRLGIEQGMIKAALGMKLAGLSTEVIEKATGLSAETIKSLA